MQYRGVWIICILVLALCILPGTSGIWRTTLSNSDSPAFPRETNHFSSKDPLWNLPPIPHFYRETLPGGVDRQWIDLSWNNLNNPHTVVIYTPDTSLGPYQNTDDGVLDGRIFLEISSDSDLTPGTWYYQIRSSRTSPYGNDTFRIYRNSGAFEV
ncbi:MAG: hypothetical protein M0Q91_10870 [Methanoregula sp.]|jgi:hypothetical protein|nr:hypothetical protein [Methanoregula sp.]